MNYRSLIRGTVTINTRELQMQPTITLTLSRDLKKEEITNCIKTIQWQNHAVKQEIFSINLGSKHNLRTRKTVQIISFVK